MILGCRIKVPRDGDPLPHTTGELVRIFFVVPGHIETNPGDPAAGMLIALVTRHALAFEPEGDIVEHGPMIKAGVILKHHAAVGPGTGHGPAHHQNVAAGGRMLGTQAGDQSQDRALAAPARAQYANELALVDQILHNERHMANRGEFVGAARIVRLGDVAKLDDVRFPHRGRLTDTGKHAADADLLARWTLDALWVSGRCGSWWGRIGGVGRSTRPKQALTAFQSNRRRSSQAWSTARTSRFNIPMPPYR